MLAFCSRGGQQTLLPVMSTWHQQDSTLGISGRGANLIYTRKDWTQDRGQKLNAQAESIRMKTALSPLVLRATVHGEST